MDLILALDTSTRRISLAVLKGGETYTKSYEGKEKHAVKLASLVEELSRDVNASLREVEFIGLGIGPGSLTGLRVGMGFAVGIAAVSGAKVVPLNSFEVIASSAFWKGERVVVRKARKGYVYMQVFPLEKKPSVLEVCKAREIISKLRDPLIMGDGREFFEGMKVPDTFDTPIPEVLIDLTLKNLERAVNYLNVKPLYVQKSIAEMNFEKKHGNG